MNQGIPSLKALLGLTARDPRAAMAQVKAMELTSPVAWQVFALVLVIELIFAQLLGLTLGPAEAPEGAIAPEIFGNPFLMGLVQGSVLVLMVFGIHWIGRAFGGQGRLEDAIALMALLQFALVVLQAIEILLVLLLPALAVGVLLFNTVAFFYLLTAMVSELHGFRRAPLVFVGIILSFLGVAFGLSLIVTIILAMLGVNLPEGLGNV